MCNSTWESSCLTRSISRFHSEPLHCRKLSLSYICSPSPPAYPNCALWSESMVHFVLTFLGVVTVLTSVLGNLEVVSKWVLPTPTPSPHSHACARTPIPLSYSSIFSFHHHLTSFLRSFSSQADYASISSQMFQPQPSFSIKPHSTSFKQTAASSLITNALT